MSRDLKGKKREIIKINKEKLSQSVEYYAREICKNFYNGGFLLLFARLLREAQQEVTIFATVIAK